MAYSIDWHLTFEGIKTFLTPIAAASWSMALIWALWFFSKDIRDLLGRVRSIKGGGVEAELQVIDKQQDSCEVASASGSLSQPVTDLPPPDAVYDDLDHQARETLNKYVSGSEDKQLAWAIRMGSISEANRLHESHY